MLSNRINKVFERADGDSNGYLGAEEVAVFVAFGDEQDADVKEFIDAAETNNDGRISLSEMLKYFENKQKTMDPAAFKSYIEACETKSIAAQNVWVKTRVAAMMLVVDSDGSGALNLQEATNWISMGDEIDPETKAFLDNADKDGNGTIALGELQLYFHSKMGELNPVEFRDMLCNLENRAKTVKNSVRQAKLKEIKMLLETNEITQEEHDSRMQDIL